MKRFKDAIIITLAIVGIFWGIYGAFFYSEKTHQADPENIYGQY